MRFAQVTTTVFAALSLAVLIGCERPAKELTAVHVDLPQTMTSNKLGKAVSKGLNASAVTATDMQIRHVVINVTGTGINTPVLYVWDACHDCSTPPPPPSQFAVEQIPSGPGRLVQILAVYGSPSSGENAFYYGDTTADLNGGEVSLPIPVTNVATSAITSGKISGRYFTDMTSGPTGTIEIRYLPPNNRPPLIIETTPIINGWFSAFALGGIDLQYMVRETQHLMWGAAVNPLSAPMDPVADSGARFDQLLRVFIPVHHRKEDHGGGNITYQPEDASINVWGYWGPGAPGRRVCTVGLGGTPSTQKLLLFSSDPTMAPGLMVQRIGETSSPPPTLAVLNNTSTPTNYVHSQGGGSGDMSSMCGSFPDDATNQFASFQKVGLSHFDGNGNDSVAGFRVPFILDFANGGVANVTGSPYVVSGKLLPGTTPAVSAIRFFKKITSQELHMEHVDCNTLMSREGFVKGAANDSTTTGDSFSITANITNAEATAGVTGALCPMKMNGMPAGEGQLVGKWNFMPSGGMNSTPMATNLFMIGPQGNFGDGAIAHDVCTPVTLRGMLNSAPAIIPQGTTINFSTGNAGIQVYSTSTCMTTPTTSLNVQGYGTDFIFFVKSALSGNITYTLQASSPTMSAGTANISYKDAPSGSDQIRVGFPNSIYAHECYPVNYQGWDSVGNVMVSFGANTVLTLPAISGLGFYLTGDCDSGTTGTAMLGGGSSGTSYAQLFVKYTGTNPTLDLQPTATAPTVSNVVGANAITVNQPGAPTKLMFGFPSPTIPAGLCVDIDLRVTDSAGHLNQAGSFTANLNASQGSFYYGHCSTPTTSIFFTAGENRKTLSYRATAPGTANVSASSTSPNLNGNMNLTVGPMLFDHAFALAPGETFTEGNPSPSGTRSLIYANQSMNVKIILVRPDNMRDTTANGPLVVNISGVVNLTHPTPLSTINFVNGEADISIIPSAAGYLTFTPEISMTGGTTLPVPFSGMAVTPADRISIYMNDANTVTAGGCQLMMVSAENSTGPMHFTTAKTFQIVPSGDGATYSDPTCTTPMSIDTMNPIVDTAYPFYYKKPTNGVETLTVQGYGGSTLVSTNFNVTVNSGSVGAASKLVITGPMTGSTLKSGACQPYFLSVADSNGNTVQASISTPTVGLNTNAGSPGALSQSCSFVSAPTWNATNKIMRMYYLAPSGSAQQTIDANTATGGVSAVSHTVNTAP